MSKRFLNRGSERRSFHLAAFIVSGILVWGWVLPWSARQPAMENHLEFLDSRGIDPSAMFYTELEAMDKILERIEADDS